MTKEELQDYLIEEAEYEQEDVLCMSSFELVDAYLMYNGIIGYTYDIIGVVQAAYDIEDLNDVE